MKLPSPPSSEDKNDTGRKYERDIYGRWVLDGETKSSEAGSYLSGFESLAQSFTTTPGSPFSCPFDGLPDLPKSCGTNMNDGRPSYIASSSLQSDAPDGSQASSTSESLPQLISPASSPPARVISEDRPLACERSRYPAPSQIIVLPQPMPSIVSHEQVTIGDSRGRSRSPPTRIRVHSSRRNISPSLVSVAPETPIIMQQPPFQTPRTVLVNDGPFRGRARTRSPSPATIRSRRSKSPEPRSRRSYSPIVISRESRNLPRSPVIIRGEYERERYDQSPIRARPETQDYRITATRDGYYRRGRSRTRSPSPSTIRVHRSNSTETRRRRPHSPEIVTIASPRPYSPIITREANERRRYSQSPGRAGSPRIPIPQPRSPPKRVVVTQDEHPRGRSRSRSPSPTIVRIRRANSSETRSHRSRSPVIIRIGSPGLYSCILAREELAQSRYSPSPIRLRSPRMPQLHIPAPKVVGLQNEFHRSRSRTRSPSPSVVRIRRAVTPETLSRMPYPTGVIRGPSPRPRSPIIVYEAPERRQYSRSPTRIQLPYTLQLQSPPPRVVTVEDQSSRGRPRTRSPSVATHRCDPDCDYNRGGRRRTVTIRPPPDRRSHSASSHRVGRSISPERAYRTRVHGPRVHSRDRSRSRSRRSRSPSEYRPAYEGPTVIHYPSIPPYERPRSRSVPRDRRRRRWGSNPYLRERSPSIDQSGYGFHPSVPFQIPGQPIGYRRNGIHNYTFINPDSGSDHARSRGNSMSRPRSHSPRPPPIIFPDEPNGGAGAPTIINPYCFQSPVLSSPHSDPSTNVIISVTSFASALPQALASFNLLTPIYQRLAKEIHDTRPLFCLLKFDGSPEFMLPELDSAELDGKVTDLNERDKEKLKVYSLHEISKIISPTVGDLFVSRRNELRDFVTLWKEPVDLCLKEVHKFVLARVDELIEMHFGSTKKLGEVVRRVIRDKITLSLQTTQDRVSSALEMESFGTTMNFSDISDYKSQAKSLYEKMVRETTEELGSSGPLRIVKEKWEKYETEGVLEEMAEMRAYFKVASNRLIDHVFLIIQHELIRKVGQDVGRELVFTIEPGDPAFGWKCKEWMKEA